MKIKILDWARFGSMFCFWLFGCWLLIDRALSGGELLESSVVIFMFALVFFGTVIYREGEQLFRPNTPAEESCGEPVVGRGKRNGAGVDQGFQRNGQELRHRLARRPILTLTIFTGVFSLPIVFVAITVLASRRQFVVQDIWSILAGEAFLVICFAIAWYRASRLVK